MDDRALLRRLRAARATGVVPQDLLDWFLDVAAEVADSIETPAEGSEDVTTSAERLAEGLADEIGRWMFTLGLSQRGLTVPRSTLVRALRGDDLRLSSVAQIADALGLVVDVRFRRPGGVISGTTGTEYEHALSPDLTIAAAAHGEPAQENEHHAEALPG